MNTEVACSDNLAHRMANQLKVYENVFVGKFLFDLGIMIGRLSNLEFPLTSVNLLQQCPDDRLLADVLLAAAAFCRLLEFKRKWSRSDKEKKKLHDLKNQIEGMRDSAEILSVSRKVHWYIEIDDRIYNREVSATATPYIDFEHHRETISFEDFVRRTAIESCSQTNDAKPNWSPYIELVIAANARSGAISLGGALLVTANRHGKLLWLAVPEIRCLSLNREQFERELGVDFGREMKRERTMEREIEGLSL